MENRFIYGVNPVLEALRARPGDVERIYVAQGAVAERSAAEVFARAREAGVRIVKVPREKLTSLAEGGVHQGVLAELKSFAYAELDDILKVAAKSNRPPLVVVLDGIEDPHNLGAIVRSAHALGAHGVVIPKDRAAGVTPVVAKASAGAIEHCPIARVVNLSRALDEMKEAGFWVGAATAGGPALASANLSGPLALVIGAEGAGIREGVLRHCDFQVGIPLVGQVASLNASVAAGIVLYEVVRQRQNGGKQAAARPQASETVQNDRP